MWWRVKIILPFYFFFLIYYIGYSPWVQRWLISFLGLLHFAIAKCCTHPPEFFQAYSLSHLRHFVKSRFLTWAALCCPLLTYGYHGFDLAEINQFLALSRINSLQELLLPSFISMPIVIIAIAITFKKSEYIQL